MKSRVLLIICVGVVCFVLQTSAKLPKISPWEKFLQQVAEANQTQKANADSPNLLNGPQRVDLMRETAHCPWAENVICTNLYEPICATNFECIFIVHNRCFLDKLNCVCPNHFPLDPRFCNNFIDAQFRRCNLQIYIQ